MTKVYVIRHAEAEGNVFRRVQGHYDGMVTGRGKRQIAALSERFLDADIDAVYSSDLTRAVQTARALTDRHGLDIIKTPVLREIRMGNWEDQPWGNLEYDYPDQMKNFAFDPENWIVPGSETFSELAERMVKAVKAIAARHEGHTVAIVTHGMAMRTLLCAVLGYRSDEVGKIPHADNTAVALLNVEGDRIDIEYYNDNSHLSDEISTFAGQTWWKEKSGTDNKNLRLLPMDMESEKKLYISCYRDAWLVSHGNLRGFDPEIYYEVARENASSEPELVMKALLGDTFVGIVALDSRKGASGASGWISLCYLRPEYRGHKLGLQLIGHAVSHFRKQGRRYIHLTVAPGNRRAVSFYEGCGFVSAGQEQGSRSVLLLLKLDIESPLG